MLVKLAWRNIWRNKKRSLITISAIFIAVFLCIILRALQLGMYDNMINNVVGSYSGYIQIHSKGFWDEQIVDNSFSLNKDFLNEIESIDGVSNTLQRIQSGSLASLSDLSKFVFVTGIEPSKESSLTNWKKRLIDGQLLTGKSKSLNIGKGVAKYFDLKIGDTLVLLGQGYQGMQAVGAYPVSGILDLKNPTLNKITVFMTLSNAQDFLSAKNMITHLILNKQENKDEDAIALNVKNLLNNEAYEVMTWREMIPELEQTIKADSAGGLVMVFILYMIVAFGIFGTVLMMTQERKYEFGVLISIGMKKIRLIKTMIYETILLASVGVFLGIALSRPIIIFLSPIKFPEEQAQMMENMGFEAVIPFMNTYDIPLTHGFIIFFISLIVCLYPLSVILKLDPIKAMKI
ncbi:MAG: transporter [Flavobacteriaceae bacterium]|nr:transporter [Flavobacteriaceae bacterium]|tara:strand:+ start:1089 stop:2300 length:1212 start_codon:yes stop_codon:yes gene_type:complete